MILPELLSPVGDLASFHAALENGANAVYVGIGRFNMRRTLDGKLEISQLPGMVAEAHAQNVKVFVTLNTIVYQDERTEVDTMLHHLKAANIDAVIASDWAVIVRARALGLEIHASTQMSCSNADAVKFLASQGIKRVVLARECTLDEIKAIAQETGVPIEVFAHGAQCVATSGRCFLSQLAYGCSANRGQCLQPCRRRYHIKEVQDGVTSDAEFEIGAHFILSAKDLCTLSILPEIVAAGIASLKLEGRARNPEYVANVTRAYRMALDAIAKGTYDEEVQAECWRLVNAVYHRSFATGLLLGRPGVEQFTPTDANFATEKKVYIGIVRNYYARAVVAEVLMHDHTLAPRDAIAIHGPTTGVLELTVGELYHDETRPECVARGEWCTFAVPRRVRPGDKVYKRIEAEPVGLR
ncbi:MAG: peptidase U32 family protein [Kiritimatiellia bacterium]